MMVSVDKSKVPLKLPFFNFFKTVCSVSQLLKLPTTETKSAVLLLNEKVTLQTGLLFKIVF